MCTGVDEAITGRAWLPGVQAWLSQEFGLTDLLAGDPEDEIIEFSYSTDAWDQAYTQEDTFRHIPDIAKNLKAIYDAYPTATFDIIGHSLGGAVALYFVTTADAAYKNRTNSIVTVDSPIAGIDHAEFLRLVVEALFDCPSLEQGEALATQLEPGTLVPTLISKVTAADWGKPHIATITNTNDLLVSPSSATLEGPSVFCMPMGATLALDPIKATLEKALTIQTHQIILQELPLWFRNIVKVAHIDRLASSPCF